MLKRFKWGTSRVIGIDLSSSSIKTVQIVRKEHEVIVEHIAYEGLPSQTIVDRKICNKAAVVASLQRLLKTGSYLKGKNAVLAVPDAVILSKQIQISNKIKEEEIEACVLLEASKHLTYPINEINFDFIVQGNSAIHPDLLDVFVIVCRTEYVEQRVEAISQAGCTVRVIEMESNAIRRVLCRDGCHEVRAVILFHHTSISMYVIDHEMRFNHEEPWGINQWPSIPVEKTLSLEVFTRPIKRMLQFYYSLHSAKIQHVLLAAEFTQFNDLPQKLEERIKIPTRWVNPFIGLTFSEPCGLDNSVMHPSSLILACGLALKEIC